MRSDPGALVGAALWVGLWSTLAYKFGLTTKALPYIWHHLSLVATVLTPLLIIVLAVLYVRSRRRRRI